MPHQYIERHCDFVLLHNIHCNFRPLYLKQHALDIITEGKIVCYDGYIVPCSHLEGAGLGVGLVLLLQEQIS